LYDYILTSVTGVNFTREVIMMSEKKVNIPNITCGHCVANIKREIEELDGVSSVDGDPETRDVTFKWDAPADWETISSALSEIGYPPEE
jgi:copper chaperone CopZ